jgi:hypothetical protein
VITEILQQEAGKDPLQDRFHTGYIAAINDLLNADLEEALEND